MNNKKYEAIVAKLIEKIEQERELPWKKPWTSQGLGPKNLVSKKPYRGFNILALFAADFESSWWLTWNQVKKLGGRVTEPKGYTNITFYKIVEGMDNKGNETTVPFLRYYRVYNLEQTVGIEAPEEKASIKQPLEPIEAAKSIVDNMQKQPRIRHNGGAAFYRPSTDVVTVPPFSAFEDTEEYYATMFHELGHSTGHKSRLDRHSTSQPTNGHSYSYEELVAEVTAAFLCGEANILPKVEENQAAYLKGWLSKLEEDPKMLVEASSAAQKAADYILGRGKE